MWVPAVDVDTPADLVTKNLESYFGNVLDIRCVAQYLFEKPIEELLNHLFCKTHFESYFDPQPPFQLEDALLMGSLKEGLFLQDAELQDVDFMCVLKHISFSREDQEDGSLLLRDDTPFVYAFVTNTKTQHLWREFLDDAYKQQGKHRLSSRKLKEKLVENYKKTGSMLFPGNCKEQLEEVTTGAAVTITKSKPSMSFYHCMADLMMKIFLLSSNAPCDMEIGWQQTAMKLVERTSYKIVSSSDIVLSIFCEGWPSCAQEWITRERLWPDVNCVEKITQSGYHIVPKSSPEGDFRLSFSCAEIMLIKTLIPLQLKVMRAFKAVIKYFQKNLSRNLKEIVSSYHLKTIAFWYFEKTSQECWTEETLVHHLVTLLQELAEALRRQNLPMYFMPKVNLLQNVDDPEVTLDLMEKISQLSHNFSAMSEALANLDGFKLVHLMMDSNFTKFNKSTLDKIRKKILEKYES